MSKSDEILRKIEELREELVNLYAAAKDLNDPEIISKSQEIDEKLNLYNRLIKEEGKD